LLEGGPTLGHPKNDLAFAKKRQDLPLGHRKVLINHFSSNERYQMTAPDPYSEEEANLKN